MRILDLQAVADFRIRLPHCSKRRDAARTQGKKLGPAHHDFRVQILNVAPLLPTRDSKPQMPNLKRRRQEGLTMFSHVSRELGAHQCIGSRASDLASDDRDVLVIGSGLGGSVAAVQLTEKGDRVRVSAVWRKVSDKNFAESTWDIKRFAWTPLGLMATQRIYLLAKVMVHAGVGDDFVNRCRRRILIKHSQRLLEIAERAVERIRAAG
jgi:hypothetical protein